MKIKFLNKTNIIFTISIIQLIITQVTKKLLDQAEAARKAAEEKKKSETAKKPEKAEKGSGEEISDEFVARQLEVIKKLFDDGVLSVEEYNKTKKFLLDKAKTAIKKEPKISDKEILTDVKIKIGKSNKITWEKAEMFYGDYRIYTYIWFGFQGIYK